MQSATAEIALQEHGAGPNKSPFVMSSSCHRASTNGWETRQARVYPQTTDNIPASGDAKSPYSENEYTYQLYRPESQADRVVPLLVLMGDPSQETRKQFDQTAVEKLAEHRSFIAVIPNLGVGSDTYQDSSDARFIRAVVRDVREDHCIDDRQIWAVGLAGGAGIAQQLVCTASDVFSAIALMDHSDAKQCEDLARTNLSSRHMPVPLIVLYDPHQEHASYQSSAGQLYEWLNEYECSTSPIETDDLSANAAIERYGNCQREDVINRQNAARKNFELILIRANGPATDRSTQCDNSGSTSGCQLNANQDQINNKVLDFLESNPRPFQDAIPEQVTFEWLTVDNPGNAADVTTGFGAVEHTFRLAKYEVTNAQYVQFLNAKAKTDELNLYSVSMGFAAGGITRSGVPGSYSYSPRLDREHRPVNWISYYDVLRFLNWMHNGQGDGDTETGAYTLEGGGPIPTNAETVRRNPDARFFLPTEDEWYKAAYHNVQGLSETDYYLYPFQTDEIPTCSPPTDEENHANCARAVTDVVSVGSYPNSIGPYGTLDQGGNVWEWSVGFVREVLPVMRGGGYYIGPNTLASSWRDQWQAGGEFSFAGFRVASPEPNAVATPSTNSSSGGGSLPLWMIIPLIAVCLFGRKHATPREKHV